MSIILFFIILFLLVLVHELGHFIVAKLTKMRVDEFGIGFPPRLYAIKKGETEYSLNALPLGGFVKIYGEDMDASKEGEDFNRSFAAKSKLAQSAVLLAGVTMNIIFAWFLFTIAFSHGVLMPVDEQRASENASLIISGVLPGSPASDAGLPPGSTVTSLQTSNDELLSPTPSEFIAFVDKHPDQPIVVSYTDGTSQNELTMTPKRGVSETTDRPLLGVSLTYAEVQSRPLLTSLKDAFFFTLASTEAIVRGIGHLIGDAFHLNADLSQVAGPVGLVSLVGQASAQGISTLLMFTAIISLNLAVINLLPFPALDGGRFVFVLIEAITGSPLNPRIVGYANMVGFAILILLMVAVTWNDVARLF